MKRISFIFCCLFTLIFCSGWTVPENTPYVEVDCIFGEYTRIYFSKYDVDKLFVADRYIVNEGNTVVVGYALTGTEIYFDPFSVPYYYGENDVVTYINITSVSLNNLHIADEVNNVVDNFPYYVVALLGGILFVVLVRRN